MLLRRSPALLRGRYYRNELVATDDFNSASWTKGDTEITSDALTGPYSDTTGDLATEGVATTASVQQPYTGTANGAQTLRLHLKRGNTDWVFMRIFHMTANTNNLRGWFNLATGAVGSATNGGTGAEAAVGIEAINDGWYLCTLTGRVNNSATNLGIAVSTALTDASTVRVAAGTYNLWGAMAVNRYAPSAPYVRAA